MKNINTENEKELPKIFNLKMDKKIIQFGNEKLKDELRTISTGSIQLDDALGNGGLPQGKIIEIYGNESSGKTTLTLQVVKKAQEMGLKCLFLDLENSLNLNYLNKIGVNINELLIANPISGEQTFEIIENAIKNNQINLIIVDSVAAMLPEIEKENDFDSLQVGAHARLMSKGLRKIQSALIENNNVTVIFINQIREKVGIMFGNPETTTGGRALRFFASIRLEIKKVDLIKSGLDKIGIKSKITVVKNKTATPLKTAYFDIYFENGFNEQNEIIEYAITHEIIKKNASYYYYNDQKIAQGIDQLKEKIKENNDLYLEIKQKTLVKLVS